MSLHLHTVQRHLGLTDPGARSIDPHADVRTADFHAVDMVGPLTTPDGPIDGIIDSHIGIRRMTKTRLSVMTMMTTVEMTQQSMMTVTAGGCSCNSNEQEAHEELHRG